MPKHAVTAAGEAMPAENILSHLTEILRAGDLLGALTLIEASAATPPIAPASAELKHVKSPALDVISFIKKRGKGEGYDYWAGVAPGAKYSEDCEIGRLAAEEFIAFIGEHHNYGNASLLGSIVIDMEKNGATHGHKIGFLNTINKYAMAGGYLASVKTPEAEHPWVKVRRLGKELSRALADTGDDEFAYILPNGTYDFPVCFGALQGLSVKAEQPVDTVDRVSKRLAFALDDWREDGAPEFIAHIYPASSGRGMWFEAVRVTPDERLLEELTDRCERALAAWDAIDDAPNASDPDNPINIEIDASRQALLDFRPTSLKGMHMKAAAMLKFRPTAEWDDLDRLQLIRAFANGDISQ